MIAIWGQKLQDEKNITLGFTLTFPHVEKFYLRLAAASVFQLFVDGKLVGFGPRRAPKGYTRPSEYSLTGQKVVVKVHSHNINSYAYMKTAPFFSAAIKTNTGQRYSSLDFHAYHIIDRIQKVARYSYQRGFSEQYKFTHNPALFLDGVTIYPPIKTETVILPPFIESMTLDPLLHKHEGKVIAKDNIGETNQPLSSWDPPFINLVGAKLEGFTRAEFRQNPLDEVDRLVPINDTNSPYIRLRFDFKRAITGFFNVLIASKAGPVYVTYDELLSVEHGKKFIDYKRNTTHNIISFNLTKPGSYDLLTFEPYTAQYIEVIAPREAKVAVNIIDFENPLVHETAFTTSDKALNLIFAAAQNTLAQNAVDILMDCPSRERAGWLSDSYFSSSAEFICTGENRVEYDFLANFNYINETALPPGMVPMVYPADDYDGVFIPNWSLWYILEIVKYANLHGRDPLVKNAIPHIQNLLTYFAGFENTDGLLENLESWVFVEWSKANDYEHIRGVNIPTNALYYRALSDAATLLNDETLLIKATKVQTSIKALAYRRPLFVDNLVRDNDGKLIQTDNFTEVCQYYLFWTKTISEAEYTELYTLLINELGPYRTAKYEYVAAPNMMYGIYMRLDLLMHAKKKTTLLEECKHYFHTMAETTHTLWENNLPSASCNHGFAAYVVRWLIYGVTGIDLLSATDESDGVSTNITGKFIRRLQAGKEQYTFSNGKVLLEVTND